MQEVANQQGIVANFTQQVAAQQGIVANLMQEVANQQGIVANFTQQVAAQQGNVANLMQQVAAQQGIVANLMQEVANQHVNVATLMQEVATFTRRLRNFRPANQDPDNFRTVWQKVIPGAAIMFQFLFDSFFNLVFRMSTSIPTANTGSGPQCTGDLDFIWRTFAFVITAGVGLVFMKWNFGSTNNTKRQWFHYFLNFYFVFSWLFAISDFPLTCWINKDGALTKDQLIKVSFSKFCIATIFVNVGVLASYTKPAFLAG